MVITHNMMAMNANRQFGINDKQKAKSTEKLASGYKINRAADDAASLSISEKMRSQIRRLHQASYNVLDGVSLVQTADGTLSEVHNILGRQRELLVSAANDIHAPEDLQSIEDELLQLSEEYDHIFKDTQFNGRYLFQGHDTIINGPNVVETNGTIPPAETSSTSSSSKIVWIDKSSPQPPNEHTETTESQVNKFKATYEETETVNSVNSDGYTLFDENSIYTEYSIVETNKIIKDVTYEKQNTDTKYVDLIKPGDMVGSNGYINVTNEARDLQLSCAMSQLGIKIDGVVRSYSLYDDNCPKTTVSSNDGKIATTTYDLGDGISLSQKIELTGASGNQSYEISYSISNTGSNSHVIDVRLAFDTMNTSTTVQKNNLPYILESDIASIKITNIDANRAAMGDIGDLYDVWEDSKLTVGENVSNHTGAGFWWDGQRIGPTGLINLGPVTYGPIELKKEPYKVTTTYETKHKTETSYYERKETTTILPEYLNIQSGANAGEKVVLRLYNLSADKLKMTVGKDKPISAFHAVDSLDHIDRTVKKMSAIRSYYGAKQNRLDVTYNNNLNYAENLESSESNIRDTDMATEVVKNTKQSILQQAAQSMIAQANQSNQDVLSLLQ